MADEQKPATNPKIVEAFKGTWDAAQNMAPGPKRDAVLKSLADVQKDYLAHYQTELPLTLGDVGQGVARAADYVGGLTRTAAAIPFGATSNLMDLATGDNRHTMTMDDLKAAALGRAPSLSEYAKRAGAPEMGKIDASVPVVGGMTGRDIAGLAGDMLFSTPGAPLRALGVAGKIPAAAEALASGAGAFAKKVFPLEKLAEKVPALQALLQPAEAGIKTIPRGGATAAEMSAADSAMRAAAEAKNLNGIPGSDKSAALAQAMMGTQKGPGEKLFGKLGKIIHASAFKDLDQAMAANKSAAAMEAGVKPSEVFADYVGRPGGRRGFAEAKAKDSAGKVAEWAGEIQGGTSGRQVMREAGQGAMDLAGREAIPMKTAVGVQADIEQVIKQNVKDPSNITPSEWGDIAKVAGQKAEEAKAFVGTPLTGSSTQTAAETFKGESWKSLYKLAREQQLSTIDNAIPGLGGAVKGEQAVQHAMLSSGDVLNKKFAQPIATTLSGLGGMAGLPLWLAYHQPAMAGAAVGAAALMNPTSRTIIGKGLQEAAPVAGSLLQTIMAEQGRKQRQPGLLLQEIMNNQKQYGGK